MFAGIAPKIANATNTVALWPGSVASVWAYKKELTARRAELISLGTVSLIGGILGALLLLKTPERTFVQILPLLLRAATLLFSYGGRICKAIRAKMGHHEHRSAVSLVGITILQLVIATYGGYFGGGIGILMLAALSLMGMEEIHSMNALKTILASLINGVAVLTFIIARAVVWPQATLMIVGAIIGGYGGAHYAQRMPPLIVRRFVIGVGMSMTGYFCVRTYCTV